MKKRFSRTGILAIGLIWMSSAHAADPAAMISALQAYSALNLGGVERIEVYRGNAHPTANHVEFLILSGGTPSGAAYEVFMESNRRADGGYDSKKMSIEQF